MGSWPGGLLEENMLSYLRRRLLLYVPTLLGALTVVFLLTNVIGDPSITLVQPETKGEDLERIREMLGLNRPLWEQYLRFMLRSLQGDFGKSFWSDRPALSLVLERLPATAELAAAAMLIAVILGVPAGVLAALKRNTSVDLGLSAVSVIGIAMPNFWLGLMLMMIFGVSLKWFPISGRGTLSHLIMPSFSLGISMMAIIVRLLRTDLLDVLEEDYIRTAWAKGLGTYLVVMKHALRNALIPTITVLGLQLGGLLSGVVVTESVFAWPGLGRLIVRSIADRDYPVVSATVFVASVIFITINLLVDVLYGILDPRIRYE